MTSRVALESPENFPSLNDLAWMFVEAVSGIPAKPLLFRAEVSPQGSVKGKVTAGGVGLVDFDGQRVSAFDKEVA